MQPDVFYTVEYARSNEIKIKGSRFIGSVSPVNTEIEINDFIAEVKKKQHGATHHCSAYRLGVRDLVVFRYHDDGEPTGTAGRPILEAIDERKLTDVVCVVTRYFGGTRLGMGGLARAYRRCAGDVLDRAGKREQFLTDVFRIVFDYDMTGPVMQVISRHGCSIEKTVYGPETELLVSIRLSESETFKRELINATSGHLRIVRREEGKY